MLYPNVQKMTNDKVNRYMLVIAAAKCARRITDQMTEEAEQAEEKKEPKGEAVEAEIVSEKPVTTAIDMLSSGEGKIITD